jgi:hypothetical protein
MDITDWINFSEEEINCNFESIRDFFNDVEFITIKSPSDLIHLRVFIYQQLSDGYFKSERHKIAFLLSKYESGAFNEELGITRRHFVDKTLAKRWMTEMQGKFHPDKNHDIKSDIDFTKISEGINKAYGEMVGRK